MTKGETELEMIPYVEGGELVIVWQKHREGLGNAVEITTGVPAHFNLPSKTPVLAALDGADLSGPAKIPDHPMPFSLL